ncbi:MAG: hypothetical protein ACREYF_17975, partial [Gammaproteobacteria bacterium]
MPDAISFLVTPRQNMSDLLSDRTKLGRYPARGSHDFATVAAILDEGFFCHVGFVVNGQPYVIPTG